MSDESPGLGQRAKSTFEQAKRRVGVGDTPLATEAGGRPEAMSEAFRAFGEGDVDRFLEAFADDVEWSGPKGDNFPGAGNLSGRQAIRETFIGDVQRSYVSFGFRPDRYLESQPENLVVALGSFIGEGVKGTGALDVPAVQLWEYDGDEVITVEIYADSNGFPGVISEQEAKEQEEEAKKEEEGEDDGDEPRDRQEDGDGEGDTDREKDDEEA